MIDYSDEERVNAAKEIWVNCMSRLHEGDVTAGLDLAKLYLVELPTNEVRVSIAVIEALVRQSGQLESPDAQKYLEEVWPDMKKIIRKRLIRRGFKDEWEK